ncbi:hypothetical protein [Sporosarcina sp. D27]|uniref:hypothetical protein n=1 Tax=Sporosarcina sp. D27 TaxID=1382305 RepID=UPI000471D7CE|nr:hypothetical protein [Sporosarcina sp. D27]
MESNAYYSSSDIEKYVGVNTTTTKLIAGATSEFITNFGAKERKAWRFNRKEMFFIKFVSDHSRLLTRDGAISEALEYFYGIDSRRDN